MSDNLTDLPGVGRKTAESLHQLGVTSPTALYRRYLRPEPDDLLDALHSQRALVGHFFSSARPTPPDGVAGGDDALPVLGFVRLFGAHRKYLRANVRSESVRPTTVDWTVGFLAGEHDALGVCYDRNVASERLDTALDDGETPSRVEAGETVTYFLGGDSVTLPRRSVRVAERITGGDYAESTNSVVIHGTSRPIVELTADAEGVCLLATPRVE